MKKYELSVLIHPDFEADLEAALTKIRGIITDAGGKIITEENAGKNRLAYTIEKQDFAIYNYMDVELPSDAPLKISNLFNITDEVLRYLLVIADEKGRAALAEAKAKRSTDGDSSEGE